MTPTQQIISAIKLAEKNNTQLTTEDTIAVFRAVKNMSAYKELIDKTLYLLLLVEKKLPNTPTLSTRETQIFNLIGIGFNSKEIATILNNSSATVATHRKNIIKKLGLTGSGKLKETAFQYTQKNI